MSYEDSPSAPSNYYGEKAMQQIGQGGLMRRTKMERLNDAKKSLETKLAEVNDAIRLLNENPKMNEIIEALEKVGI